MLFCIDCKHYEPQHQMCAEAKRRTREVSPVDGKDMFSLSYCEAARKGVGANYCGPEGIWFIQKVVE